MQQMSEKPPFSFFLQILHHCGDIIQWKRGIEWKERGEGRRKRDKQPNPALALMGHKQWRLSQGQRPILPTSLLHFQGSFLPVPLFSEDRKAGGGV